jgi:hypothetical protein
MNDLADASDTNLQSTTKMGEDLKNFAHMDRIDIHLYAATASTDTIEVTTEQDRFTVWQAQSEKYNNKNNFN